MPKQPQIFNYGEAKRRVSDRRKCTGSFNGVYKGLLIKTVK